LAILRAAAAAGLLLALAPEQTREALSAVFVGVEEARKAAPGKEDAAAAAMRLCAGNPEACSRLAREAVASNPKFRP
jgi:hypothetical protein